MKSKTNYVLLLCCVACIIGSSSANMRNKISMKLPDLFRRQSKNSDNIMDVTDFSVYYDLDTNQTIRKMMPRPWYKPGWALRLPFTGGKCDCGGLQCTCCTGIRIETLNFDRRTCTILTFEPTESTLDVEVKMNNESVYRNTFSAVNAPPFCVPITVPYLPPGLMDMCMRLFDIRIVEQMLHVCMDIDTRIDKAPVLVLHFDCMDMGLNGIGLSKPSETPTNTLGTDSATAETGQLDSDIYDPVTENSLTTASMFNNSIKYI